MALLCQIPSLVIRSSPTFMSCSLTFLLSSDWVFHTKPWNSPALLQNRAPPLCGFHLLLPSAGKFLLILLSSSSDVNSQKNLSRQPGPSSCLFPSALLLFLHRQSFKLPIYVSAFVVCFQTRGQGLFLIQLFISGTYYSDWGRVTTQ